MSQKASERKRLTDARVRALPLPKDGQAETWDADLRGFGIRISAGGRRSWVVMYRSQGRLRRLTLGTYPSLKTADARDKAKDALYAVAKGGDPAADKTAERRAETFRELAGTYIDRYAKLRKRSWRKDKQIIDRDLIPAIGNRKIGAVTKAEIHAILDDIVERGAPIQANRTLEVVRKIYNWAMSRGMVENNPSHGIPKPSAENRSERVLTEAEIRAIWKALDKQPALMAGSFKVRFYTAQRPGEVSRMRWVDLDLEGGWWTIPAEFVKNRRSHRVPLSAPTIAILEAARTEVAAQREKRMARGKPVGEESPWVFPSPYRDGKPLSVIWKAARAIRVEAGVDFVPHDIRRTAASYMTSLGISRLTVGKILNHVEPGITAVYDRHSYDAEKRAALDAWAARLDGIIDKKSKHSNVVVLHGEAG